MNKKYWIILLIFSVILNVILSFMLNSYNSEKRKIYLKNSLNSEEIINLNKKQNKYNILIELPDNYNCLLGISKNFIGKLNNIKKYVDNYYIVSNIYKKHLNKIKEKYSMKNLYIDKKNILRKRIGGFIPSISIVDNKGRILFHAPCFKDEKYKEYLLYQIDKIVSLP